MIFNSWFTFDISALNTIYNHFIVLPDCAIRIGADFAFIFPNWILEDTNFCVRICGSSSRFRMLGYWPASEHAAHRINFFLFTIFSGFWNLFLSTIAVQTIKFRTISRLQICLKPVWISSSFTVQCIDYPLIWSSVWTKLLLSAFITLSELKRTIATLI